MVGALTLPNNDSRKFTMSTPIVVALRESSSMASTWSEYLCLSKGKTKPYKLFIGQYEFLAELDDYYDEDADDYVVPEQIDGKAVVSFEDDYVVGGDLLQQEESDAVEFSSVFDTDVRAWLKKISWDGANVLVDIEKAITTIR